MSERAGKNGKVPPKEYRFSRTYQPSPQAKSEGMRKWHDRRRLKDDLLAVFAEEIKTTEGKTVCGMDALAKRLLHYFLETNPKKMSATQAGLALKFFGILAPAKVEIGPAEGGKMAVNLFFDKEDEAA